MYLPLGKRYWANGPVCSSRRKILVADLQVHPVGLVLQDGSLHQNLPGTLRHVGHQKVRKVLLLQLARGKLVDLRHLDGGALADQSAEDSRLANRRKDSGDCRLKHCQRCRAQA